MKKIILLLVVTSSCATVKHGTTQPISIDSYPVGASVRMNGEMVGHTPLVIERSRTERGTGVLSVEHPGYERKDQVLTQTLSGAFWGNILLGGPIGMIVDAVTGAWANIVPHQMNFQLARSNQNVSNTSIPTSLPVEKVIGNTDEIKVRLDTLKQAKEDGLITEQEYKAKRKAVIDAL